MRRFALAAVVFAIVTAMALPAAAAPATTEKVGDFYTLGLDANGDFKMVFCHKAHQVWKGDRVKETYSCHFQEYLDFWGPNTSDFGAAALPKKAMKWTYDSTGVIVDNNLGLSGPFRWYSDVSDILDMPAPDCFMYAEDYKVVITPSGNLKATVVYDPPYFEGDCPT